MSARPLPAPAAEAAAAPAALSLRGVCLRHADGVALQPTDLDLAAGEFVTVLGPSGCGKSTLLRIACGIGPSDGGSVWMQGRRVDLLPPERRDIALAFQHHALFPHLSVRRNIGFGLAMKRVPAFERRRRLAEAVALCRLEGLLDRMPGELSGGQQQRVALARAVVMQPAVLLLDEPLSGLDAGLRESLRRDLLALHRRHGCATLHVTHDQGEALALSDRIVVMNAGRVIESGTPAALYAAPASTFAARALGRTNLLTLPLERGAVRLPWGELAPLADAPPEPACGTATVSLRPERLCVQAAQDGIARIERVEFVGAQWHYDVRLGALKLQVCAAADGGALAVGSAVRLALAAPLSPLRPLRE